MPRYSWLPKIWCLTLWSVLPTASYGDFLPTPSTRSERAAFEHLQLDWGVCVNTKAVPWNKPVGAFTAETVSHSLAQSGDSLNLDARMRVYSLEGSQDTPYIYTYNTRAWLPCRVDITGWCRKNLRRGLWWGWVRERHIVVDAPLTVAVSDRTSLLDSLQIRP